MPRKSAAALAIPPLTPPLHPSAPAELTPAQAKIWRGIVACRPPEYFDGACHALLVAYCRHVDTGNVLAAAINATDTTDKRYGRLLMMAARESKLVSALSAKLRLAPQHVRRIEQVLPKMSARRPWEFVS